MSQDNKNISKISTSTSEYAHSEEYQEKELLHCLQCDYSSYKKHYLRQHIDLVHNNERRFKCPFCDYAGKRSHSLKEHLVVHCDIRLHRCTECNATFRKKGHLTNHYKMHSTVSTVASCRLCDEPFDCLTDLYHHLRNEHSDASTAHFCKHCHYATTIKCNLTMHEATHSDPSSKNVVTMQPKFPPTANIILKCSVCGFETTTKKILEQHVLAKHVEKPIKQECVTVRKPVPTTVRNFVPVSGTSVLPKAIPTSAVVITTPHKNITTTSRHPVHDVNVIQISNKSGRKKNVCVQCGYDNADMKKFIMHVVSHRPSVSEAATACARTVLTNAPFSQDRDSYACNICGYVCDMQRTIKAHMWKHSGHQNLEYPMFQNGPLSVYDNTPLAPKNFEANNATRTSAAALSDRSTTSFAHLALSTGDVIAERIPGRKEGSTEPRVIVQPVVNEPSLVVPKELTDNSSEVNKNSLPFSLESLDKEEVSDDSIVDDDYKVSSPHRPVIVEVMESCEPDALQIMTQVCESVNRQLPTNTAASKETVESAATILSLLRTGPNINPACPQRDVSNLSVDPEPDLKKTKLVMSDSESIVTETSDSVSSVALQKKGGICSSLLAVIEQLRERQGQGDSDESSSPASNKPKRTRKRKLTSKKEEILPLAQFPNAEPLSPSSDNTCEDGNAMYRCKLCHYSSTASLMKQHMKMHRNKKPFECSLCNHVAKNTSALQDHMILHCKVRSFQCKKCPVVFRFKSQLRAHMRVHEEGQAFYCDFCEYATSQLSLFRNHLNLHSETITSFSCIACRQKFTELEDLRLHMKESCIEARKLYQSQTSKPEEILSLAERSGTVATDSDEPKRTLHCEQCDFIALSIRSLKSHLKRHMNDRRYIEQPLEQYKCNICGYVCHHLPSLKSHMWRHANDSNFSYTFTNSLSESTTPTDSDGKPLVTLRCCQCGYETLDKQLLNTHMISHWDLIKKTFDVCE